MRCADFNHACKQLSSLPLTDLACLPPVRSRATSAPHSMNLIALQQQQQEEQQRQPQLSPTGGPIRRVASSLGMRRSNSFLWTPASHRDFERAIGYLNARGTTTSAAAIVQLMRQSHADIKVQDVEKHLRVCTCHAHNHSLMCRCVPILLSPAFVQKKFLVQRRIMQQLTARERISPTVRATDDADDDEVCLDGNVGDHAAAAATAPRVFIAGIPAGGMAAVAEEPVVLASSRGPSPPCVGGLSDQLHQQHIAHRQLESMREQANADPSNCCLSMCT